MFAGAAVAVAAGADFVVEGAVYFVLLCAEDGSEITREEAVLVGLFLGKGREEILTLP